MCLGAVGWSGIARLVCAAGDQDARAIGFDEGDKPADWQSALARRGVIVATGVLRARAAAAMERYRDTGGLIYHGCDGGGGAPPRPAPRARPMNWARGTAPRWVGKGGVGQGRYGGSAN